jgi:hypothetical protein
MFYAKAFVWRKCKKDGRKGARAKDLRRTRFLTKENVKKLNTMCFVR